MAGVEADTKEQRADAADATEQTPEQQAQAEAEAEQAEHAEQVSKVGAVLDRVFGPQADDSGEVTPTTPAPADDVSGDGTTDPEATTVEDDGGYTPDLLAAAKDAGYTDESARQFQPEQLTAIVAAHNRRMADIGRAAQKARRDEAKAEPPAKPEAKAEVTEAEVPAPVDHSKALDALDKVTAADYGEEVAEAMKAVKGVLSAFAKESASLRKELTKAQAAPKPDEKAQGFTEEQRAEFEAIDACFDGLGEDYADLFGKGKWTETDHWQAESNREAAKARNEVLGQMVAIAVGRDHAGMKPISTKALFGQAVASLHEGKVKETAAKGATKALKDKLRTRQGQRTFTVPPTHTAPPPGSKESKQLSRFGAVLDRVNARKKG